MARRPKTTQQAADRYGKGVTQAGPAYTQGVQNAASWVEGATAASNRRNAGLQAAIASGAIDAGIQRTGDAGWKTKTLAKGPNAYTAAAQTATPAYLAGMNRAAPYQQAAQQAVAGIDTSTLEGRLQKMVTYARTVAAAKAAATGRQ